MTTISTAEESNTCSLPLPLSRNQKNKAEGSPVMKKQKRQIGSNAAIQDSFVQAHMRNHYQRLYLAKATVDTTPPRSYKKRKKLLQKGWKGESQMEPQHRTHRVSSSQGGCKSGLAYLESEERRMLLMKKPSSPYKDQCGRMIQAESALSRDKLNTMKNNIYGVPAFSGVDPQKSALHASEKIAIFLDSVQQEEEFRIQDKSIHGSDQKSYLSLSQGTVLSRTFPFSSQLLQKPSSSSSCARDRHAGCFQFPAETYQPSVMVKNAKSHLLNSRVYNPPRKRKKTQESQNRKQHHNPVVPPLEIGPDSDQEEWLHEQAIRGQARQWVAQELRLLHTISDPFTHTRSDQVNNTVVSNGKESSKDSAYNGGFSSGESRAPTRGPTPDYHINLKKGQKSSVFQNNNQTLSRSSAVQSSMKKKKVQEEEKEQEYLKFLNDVTFDILNRGIYTNRGLKQVFRTHVEKRKRDLEMECMLEMLEKLRIDLGIPKDDSLNGIEFGVGCLDYGNKFTFHYAGTNDGTVSGNCATKLVLLCDTKPGIVRRKSKEKLDSKQSPVIVEETADLIKHKKIRDDHLVSDSNKIGSPVDVSVSEAELCHILKDLDLDQAMTAEILELVKQTNNSEDYLKICQSDNISEDGSVKWGHDRAETEKTPKHQGSPDDIERVKGSSRSMSAKHSSDAQAFSSKKKERGKLSNKSESLSDAILILQRSVDSDSDGSATSRTRSDCESDVEQNADSDPPDQYTDPSGTAADSVSEKSETDLYSQSESSSQVNQKESHGSDDGSF